MATPPSIQGKLSFGTPACRAPPSCWSHDVDLVSCSPMALNTLIRNADRRPAPGLNLSSNNPFRRAASPSALSPNSAAFDHNLGAAPPSRNPRPVSTNPSLDSYKTSNPPEQPQHRQSPPKLVGPLVEPTQRYPTEQMVSLSHARLASLYVAKSISKKRIEFTTSP